MEEKEEEKKQVVKKMTEEEERSPAYTYYEKGHPVPKVDLEALWNEQTYRNNPDETKLKFVKTGAMEISRLLRGCNVPNDIGQKIMDAILAFYAMPIVLGLSARTENMLNKAVDDIHNKKLMEDELALRLLIRLHHDRTERRIDAHEKKMIRGMMGNLGISALSRIFERSKSTISEIVYNNNDGEQNAEVEAVGAL